MFVFVLYRKHVQQTVTVPVALYGVWNLVSQSHIGGEVRTLKVFKNMVLRRVIEHEKDELIRGRRKLHNEELLNLHCSNIITVIKSRRMRWARNVAHIEVINAFKFLNGKSEGMRSLEGLNVGRVIILK